MNNFYPLKLCNFLDIISRNKYRNIIFLYNHNMLLKNYIYYKLYILYLMHLYQLNLQMYLLILKTIMLSFLIHQNVILIYLMKYFNVKVDLILRSQQHGYLANLNGIMKSNSLNPLKFNFAFFFLNYCIQRVLKFFLTILTLRQVVFHQFQ